MYDAVNKKPVLCDNIVGRIGREVEGFKKSGSRFKGGKSSRRKVYMYT